MVKLLRGGSVGGHPVQDLREGKPPRNYILIISNQRHLRSIPLFHRQIPQKEIPDISSHNQFYFRTRKPFFFKRFNNQW